MESIIRRLGKYSSAVEEKLRIPGALPEEIRDLAEEFLEYVEHVSRNKVFEEKLLSYARRHGIYDVALLFEGNLRLLSRHLLGEEWAGLWDLYMKARPECPYPTGSLRRQVRSRNVELHVPAISKALAVFYNLKGSGLSSTEILADETEDVVDTKFGMFGSDKSPWLAAMIMKGDEECIGWLTEAMTSENNANRLQYAYLRAIAISGHTGLLELEGKLLLAARLQEGLRQAILDTISEGRPESFKYLLNVIIDNGLQRYPAVKRGLVLSTGLPERYAQERYDDKYLTLVQKYINDRDAARKAVGSNDAMEVYLGLWSLAFHEADDIKAPVENLIKSAPTYLVQTALVMLDVLHYPGLCTALASEAIHSRPGDHSVLAGVQNMYLKKWEYSRYVIRNYDQYLLLEDFFPSRKAAEADFEMLTGVISGMKEDETFSPYGLPGYQVTLFRSNVAEYIADIALMLDDNVHIDRALDYIVYLEPVWRPRRIRQMIRRPYSRKMIEYAVNGMGGRVNDMRHECCETVVRLFNEGQLTSEDCRMMEDHLRLKAADMRVTVIQILSLLDDDDAKASVRRLVSDKSAERRMAGLEIIRRWMEDGGREGLVQELLPDVCSISSPTGKEKEIVRDILGSCSGDEATYNLQNGFGLYDPSSCIDLTVQVPEDFDIEKFLTPEDPERPLELLRKIMNLISENADYEFKDINGETKRFGNDPVFNYRLVGIESLAMPEMWKEFCLREAISPMDMFHLTFAIGKTDECDEPFFPLLGRILGKAFHIEPLTGNLQEQPYYLQATTVVEFIRGIYITAKEIKRKLSCVIASVVSSVSADELVLRYDEGWYSQDKGLLSIQPFRDFSKCLNINGLRDDEVPLIRDAFAARYGYCRKLGFRECTKYVIDPVEYLRMRELGLITAGELWHEMMGRETSPLLVRDYTTRLPGADMPRPIGMDELSPGLTADVLTAVDRILDIELKRGDVPTDVSELASEIMTVTGTDYYIRILAGMGRDKPTASMRGNTKNAVLSHLLHVCRPGENDNAEELRRRASAAGISDERLVEAAMFSTRWLALTEKAIGWDGLESAAYYFLVHTGVVGGDEISSKISRYTSVPVEDFADGAFDPAWFREVYEQLGPKRYKVIYTAARYISDGKLHARSRKLSDAALGVLDPEEVRKAISEKRNKDLVVAYGLIPLGPDRMADMRRRYDALSLFLKESRQFGSQRQATESRAVKLALDNLARTAGYGDSTRLTWSMEAGFLEEVSEYLSPKETDGVTMYIDIVDGIPELVVESNGKRLQNIPARLRKDQYAVKLKEVFNQLKDQHLRGRVLLEEAMVEGSEFTGGEIAGLKSNPIIWAMLSRLVLTRDGVTGFPGEDGTSIVSASGESIPVAPEDRLRIAHPCDLLKSGAWSIFQTILYDRQWKQPFKQVFRELYLPVDEEKDTSRSMRYSGNQIMPSRVSAVLKKRHWTVDYENGLQKVCFNGNVTTVLYAMADWFSPSEIEPPTLEYVEFYDRRTMSGKKIREIPPMVFSEIMRDIDLAVSIGHAGGVDPETSHSTIEMRRVIMEHSISLFGIRNAEISGNYVKVKGTLASYNIHLGSGIIHKEGGLEIVVLPVHTQSRGRIFLPFLDEDPKTAEIISKVLLFSSDSSIKDPSILRQI